MDKTVGDMLAKLVKTSQYNNTIIMFLSDNGARQMPEHVQGSNFPLRGYKGSVFEGGTKVPAFLNIPTLKPKNQR